ncbi:MAG: protein-methionine-sulfoxide reductase heme-binding subunit MsrQ [Dehalococcoidia bacterium]|nr:protein-methionine-sulfoxide reductase heme-binding subunit MsrQ [Dehalococcoidia bacterium]
MAKSQAIALRAALHLAALLPLAWLIWDYAQGNLTANPIREITLRTGRISLVLLMLSLACTPLRTIFGVEYLQQLRKPLGLYAFFYASLHLLNIAGLDYGFDFGLLFGDVLAKQFALTGLVAYLLLLPLAVTATEGWASRLGARWTILHRLVYPAAALSVAHLFLEVKAGLTQPLVYGAVLAFLLVLRIPPASRLAAAPRGWITRKRRKNS